MENQKMKKSQQQKSKRERVSHRHTIETATEFQTGWSSIATTLKKYIFSKHSIFKTACTFFIVYAPFFHIHVEASTTTEIGGYTYLMSFLWAIGYPLSALAFGMLFNYYAKSEVKDRLFRIVLSYCIMAVAAFYITMAFFPITKEYGLIEYHLIISAIAILAVIILVYISAKVRQLEDALRDPEKLKEIFRNIFAFLADNVRKGRIKENHLPQYEKESNKILKDVLDFEQP